MASPSQKSDMPLATAEEVKVTPVTLHCHCETHILRLVIPSSLLPLHGSHCHCHKCRHISGVLFASYARLPDFPDFVPPFDVANPPDTLTAFISQHGPDETVKRWFCNKCGTHLLYTSTPSTSPATLSAIAPASGGAGPTPIQQPPSQWWITTGSMEQAGERFVKYEEHIWTASCVDDGVDTFSTIPDDGVPRLRAYETDEGSGPLSKKELDDMVVSATGCAGASSACRQASTLPGEGEKDPQEDSIWASCFCGGVQCRIFRPIAYPDNSYLARFATKDRHKWIASLCVCESCRRSTGMPVVPFIFIPYEHVHWEPSGSLSGTRDTGTPAAYVVSTPTTVTGTTDTYAAGLRLTSLKSYRSSSDVERSFCKTCGATVLYQVDIRPEFYDFAPSLLITSNVPGRRLADWIEIRERVSWPEDAEAYDPGLRDAVVRGAKAYVEARESSA